MPIAKAIRITGEGKIFFVTASFSAIDLALAAWLDDSGKRAKWLWCNTKPDSDISNCYGSSWLPIGGAILRDIDPDGGTAQGDIFDEKVHTITDISLVNTDEVQVTTSEAHGLSVDDKIFIENVAGDLGTAMNSTHHEVTTDSGLYVVKAGDPAGDTKLRLHDGTAFIDSGTFSGSLSFGAQVVGEFYKWRVDQKPSYNKSVTVSVGRPVLLDVRGARIVSVSTVGGGTNTHVYACPVEPVFV